MTLISYSQHGAIQLGVPTNPLGSNGSRGVDKMGENLVVLDLLMLLLT